MALEPVQRYRSKAIDYWQHVSRPSRDAEAARQWNWGPNRTHENVTSQFEIPGRGFWMDDESVIYLPPQFLSESVQKRNSKEVRENAALLIPLQRKQMQISRHTLTQGPCFCGLIEICSFVGKFTSFLGSPCFAQEVTFSCNTTHVSASTIFVQNDVCISSWLNVRDTVNNEFMKCIYAEFLLLISFCASFVTTPSGHVTPCRTLSISPNVYPPWGHIKSYIILWLKSNWFIFWQYAINLMDLHYLVRWPIPTMIHIWENALIYH